MTQVRPMPNGNFVPAENNKRPGGGLSIAALILAFIPAFSLIGLILAIIALAKGCAKKGLAIAALLIAIIQPIVLVMCILIPSINYARSLAQTAASASNLGSISKGIKMYEIERSMKRQKPCYPENLLVVCDPMKRFLREETLQYPGDEGPEVDYIYVQPADDADPGIIMACERKIFHNNGRNVLLVSGTVVWMPEEDFQESLQAPENAKLAEALANQP